MNYIQETMLFELKKSKYVSITCDNWQSNSNNDYLGVTCHFIDNKFNLISKNLSLKFLNEAKTHHYLFNVLNNCLEEWKLDNKVIFYSI